jgi:hypothetical protein
VRRSRPAPRSTTLGYGCWQVARLLVERGARVDGLSHAAALGMLAHVEELLDATPAPGADALNEAFWQACHGGQRRVAEYLLERGADINAIPGYADQTSLDTRKESFVSWLRSKGASSTKNAS